MATIHISKTDALLDPAALLQQAAEGNTIVVESEDGSPVVIHSGKEDFYAATEAGHDEWARARIMEGLADEGAGIAHERVIATMREKVAIARRKKLDLAI